MGRNHRGSPARLRVRHIRRILAHSTLFERILADFTRLLFPLIFDLTDFGADYVPPENLEERLKVAGEIQGTEHVNRTKEQPKL